MLKEHDIVSLANVPILTNGAAWSVTLGIKPARPSL